MGKFSRSKGARGERKVRDMLNDLPGVDCRRVPLSGANFKHSGSQHDYGDLRMKVQRELGEETWTVEVKCRDNDRGFKIIKEWLDHSNLLMICEDYKRPLVVMPYHFFAHLIQNFDPVAKYPPKTKEGQPWYIPYDASPEEINHIKAFLGIKDEKNETDNGEAQPG